MRSVSSACLWLKTAIRLEGVRNPDRSIPLLLKGSSFAYEADPLSSNLQGAKAKCP